MSILGMRDLKTKGIFPIKKAYISIDLNAIKTLGEKSRKKRKFKTIPSESGKNPNLGTIVTYIFF